MINNYYVGITIIAMFGLSACGSSTPESDILDGAGDVNLRFISENFQATIKNTVSETTSLQVTDTEGNVAGVIELDSAWMVVKEIEFEHEAATDDSDVKIEFKGPYLLDILSGTTYPEIEPITIDTGYYQKIEFDIEKLDSDDKNDDGTRLVEIKPEMEHYSLMLSGQYTSYENDIYSKIPFQLLYDQTDEFELSGDHFHEGITINDSGINDVIVAFDMQEWFRFDNLQTNNGNIEFEHYFDSSPNGTEIVLDTKSNENMVDVIEDNIEDSASFGEDASNDKFEEEDESNSSDD